MHVPLLRHSIPTSTRNTVCSLTDRNNHPTSQRHTILTVKSRSQKRHRHCNKSQACGLILLLRRFSDKEIHFCNVACDERPGVTLGFPAPGPSGCNSTDIDRSTSHTSSACIPFTTQAQAQAQAHLVCVQLHKIRNTELRALLSVIHQWLLDPSVAA